MAIRLFVGGLSFSTTDEILRDEFARYGAVESAEIVRDHDGHSRGFGFVEMTTVEDAEQALASLNGETFDGRPIRVEKALSSGRAARGVGGPPRR